MRHLQTALWLFIAFTSENAFAVRNEPLMPTISLPTPKGLEDDIRFWENVFSTYTSQDYVVHDKENLNIIYSIQHMKSGNFISQRNFMRRHVDRIQATLRQLGQGEPATTTLQKQVAESVPKSSRIPAMYRMLAHRLRYQQGVGDNFNQSLKRSEQILPIVRKIVQERGLPPDLAYLPHLESGFHLRAESKVGARGLWQIMPYLARGNLIMNRRVDERLDPRASTLFATRYLRSNYQRVRSWPLAITGYNYGINGILRAVRKHRTTDYMTIRRKHSTRVFGFAAKNFYPSFLAARNLAHRHEIASSGRKGPNPRS